MNYQRMEQKRGYGVKTAKGSYLCTNGNVYKPMFCGPNTGHSIKIWRTIEGAQKYADRIGGTVIKVQELNSLPYRLERGKVIKRQEIKMEHKQDTDCTLDNTDTCTVCHVYHGEPCPTCGGRGYHKSNCIGCDGCKYYKANRCKLWEVKVSEPSNSHCESWQSIQPYK